MNKKDSKRLNPGKNVKTRDEILNGEDVHWLRFRWQEWLIIVVVVATLGGMLNYNLMVANAKARDWERKQQTKKVYNTLNAGYLVSNGGLPPNTDQYEIRGCGDLNCPLSAGEGTPCLWGSNKPSIHLACGNEDFMWLEPIPDNPQTPGGDRLKYKQIDMNTGVVEVCLERKDDPEVEPIYKSKIGWTMSECPSGGILSWPDSEE